MRRTATPAGAPFTLRRVTGAVVALVAVVASGALGAAGPAAVSSPTAGSPPPARPPGLTTARNAACTAAHRFQAVDRGLGPFCLPPDAIRAIDDPAFVPASRADFLDPAEPVLVLRVGDRARAYPVRVLVFHEIVNDRVGDVPVGVTFCPLCNSGLAFDRRLDGRTLTFGVSGRLRRANLLMFDRETETLWQQLTGEAVRGPLEGRALRILPVQMVSLGEFRRSAPDAPVMSVDTGYAEPYGRDPYAGYGLDPDRPSSFQFGAEADPRLPPKARVLGVAAGGEAAAVPLPDAPGGRRVVPLVLGGEEVVVLLAHGTRQPATGGSFATDPEGWAAAAFRPSAGGRPVSLRAGRAGFVDEATGSVFGLTGTALSGPLAGRSLEPVLSADSFWFAWSYFYPGTAVVRP